MFGYFGFCVLISVCGCLCGFVFTMLFVLDFGIVDLLVVV